MKDVVNFTPRPLSPRKIIRHPSEQARLATDPRSGRFVEEKIPFLLSGFEPWIVQPPADTLTDCAIPRNIRSSICNTIVYYICICVCVQLFVKVKFTLEQAMMAQMEGSRCTALLFLQPQRKDGGGWSTPCTGRFTPRERPGTHCIGGWVGPQGRSVRVRKILPPPGFDPRTVRSVASRYTDWAIPAPRAVVATNSKS